MRGNDKGPATVYHLRKKLALDYLHAERYEEKVKLLCI